MTTTPLLNELNAAAAEPQMPLSMMPQMLPAQWAINTAAMPDGQKVVVVTIHQPNQMTHVTLDLESARRLVAQLTEAATGLTVAKAMPA